MNEGDAGDARKAVVLTLEARMATIMLSRPPVNAINDSFLQDLNSALDEIGQHPEIILVRIRSAHAAFSAGADLRMVRRRIGHAEGAEDMARTAALFHQVYDRLAALPAVTVAYMSGHALGGGLELALACDLRIAARGSKIGLPETKVGLLPGAGGTQRLTNLCGPGVAARLILAGEVIDGLEAHRNGIVQWVFDDAVFQHEADRICAQIVEYSGPALRHAKHCIGRAAPVSPDGARAEITGIHALMMTSEAGLLVDAFLSGG